MESRLIRRRRTDCPARLAKRLNDLTLPALGTVQRPFHGLGTQGRCPERGGSRQGKQRADTDAVTILQRKAGGLHPLGGVPLKRELPHRLGQ